MLKKIRRDRRNATILSLAIAFMIAIVIQQYWDDIITGLVIWPGIGVLFALTVVKYYITHKAQVLRQIEQLAQGNSINE